jgi:hypothetical protein
MMRRSYLSGGVRAVAVIEAAKAVLVLAAGCGLLSLIHRDVAKNCDISRKSGRRRLPESGTVQFPSTDGRRKVKMTGWQATSG